MKDHTVRWEIWPEHRIASDGSLGVVGYALELYGSHAHVAHRPSPGCDECVAVYRKLREVADWVMPEEPHGSDYQVQRFDHALHYAHGHEEVRLTIRILHRSNIGAPLDVCQTACLREMEHRLRLLGAGHGTAASTPPSGRSSRHR